MASAQRTKASDKQRVIKKLVSLLKKRYKTPARQPDRPVLESILYAICLEDSPASLADTNYERLVSQFHDLNEVRVSSISELAVIFKDVDDAEWRALRVRSILQYVFEKNFAFEFETLRRKTLELAGRQLARIKELTSFVRLCVLQDAVGGHLIPVDQRMTDAAIWLGLVEPGSTPEQASESLKPAVKKADAPQFCALFRCLATDPRVQKEFASVRRRNAPDAYDLESAPARLTELFKRPPSTLKRAKSAAKKTSRRTAAKKAAGKSTARRTGKRTAAKTASGRKAANKKTGRKTTARKRKK